MARRVRVLGGIPMVEQLADATIPLEGSGVALLALALTSTDFRAAGVDAAVAAVHHGRFDPAARAGAVAQLQRANLLVLTRLSQPVADLAATSPLHRLRAQQFLLARLEALDERPHGLHGPLETLAQPSAGGITIPPPTRRVLTGLAGQASKAGRAARTVLAHARS